MVKSCYSAHWQEMQDNYTFLLSVYETLLDTLKDGGCGLLCDVRQCVWGCDCDKCDCDCV